MNGDRAAARFESNLARVVAGCFALAICALALLHTPPAFAAAPTVTVKNASNVKYTTATATGTLNPSTHETTYYFQYATEADFSNAETAGVGFLPANAGTSPVEAELVGLKAGSTYYLRLVAENEEGTASAKSAAPFVTKAVSKPTVSINTVTSIGGRSAHLSGDVNPNAPGPAPQDPAFETTWLFECTPGCISGNGQLPADNKSHAVATDASGLEPNTEYSVVLIAVNNAGERSESSPEVFKTASIAPEVLEEKVLSVGSDSAVVGGLFDSANQPTSYRVEYGPTTAYGSSTTETSTYPAQPPQRAFTSQLLNLVQGTLYHWRLVVTNGSGSAAGPDRTFTTFASANEQPNGICPNELFRTSFGRFLPNCRAYEQTTEVSKNGSEAIGSTDTVEAAPDGNGITFFSYAGVPGGQSTQAYPTFVARRGAGSWTTRGLLPPESKAQNVKKMLGVSPDLRYAVVEVENLVGAHGRSLTIEDTQTGEASLIVPYTECNFLCFALVSVNDAGSKVFFESTLALSAGATTGVQNFYVWDRASGSVSSVGVLPGSEGGEVPSSGSFAGPYLWVVSAEAGGGPEAGGALRFMYAGLRHAVSEDGSRAFFTTANAGQLYMRANLLSGEPATVRISAPEPGVVDVNGEQPAAFIEATPDGTRALFLSSQHLTKDATTGSEDLGKDLYRFNSVSRTIEDLTPDSNPIDPNGAEVQGVLGSSVSGDVIYFAANGVLTSGAPKGNCDNLAFGDETERVCNIYRYDDRGLVPSIHLVATVNGTGGFDRSQLAINDTRNWSPVSRILSENTVPVARVSADGSVLLFSSIQELTGYSNRSSLCVLGGRCTELYRYAASDGSLNCVSCSPTGARPVAGASLASGKIGAGPITVRVGQFITKNLSADGDRVVFQTPDPLLSSDTNGDQGCSPTQNRPVADELNCQDVYEWESVGAPGGTCSAATASGGCLHLISTGQSPVPSYFGDADVTSDNIFFFTRAQLVPADRDELRDVYDARVGGGLSSQYPPLPQRCEGETCQGSTQPPAAQTPGSSTVNGPRNRRHHRKHRHRRHRRKHRARHSKSRQRDGKASK